MEARLAGMKTGIVIGPVSAAFNGSISGLGSMGMSGFADTNAWAGSFNGNSLQNTSGFSGIGLDGVTHNLDLLASTGAGAAGSVSGSGFDMSGVGMASTTRQDGIF